MRPLLAGFVITLLCCAPGRAQQPTPARTAAARALMEEMGMPTVVASSVNTMLEVQLNSDPAMRPLETVMRSFLEKYMSWSAIGDQVIAVYAEAFTEQELADLTAFYRTPTGRKMSRLLPDLTRRGGEIGQRAVQEHLPELQEMVQEAIQRQRTPSGTP
jgi:uncharacterized protein